MRNLFHYNENKNQRLLYLLIGLLLALNTWIIIRPILGTKEKIIDAYWTVTLDTGQIFYGKIDKIDGESIALKDAFYYQPGVSSVNAENIRITKVGTELHQPQDIVFLNRTHIISRQVMTSDSRVVKAIQKYKGESL